MQNLIRLLCWLCIATMLITCRPDITEPDSPDESAPPPTRTSSDTLLSSGIPLEHTTDVTLFLKRLIEPEFVVGATSVTFRYAALEHWMTAEVPLADLGQLDTSGKLAPLLVYGDGLAAGWKDGGLYRQGQQFAFPALVARQMGLNDFNAPLFEPEHANGTGFLVPDPPAPGPRWREVTNHLALRPSGSLPGLVPYTGEEVENFAAPKLDRAGLGGRLSPAQKGWMYDQEGRGYTDDMVFLWRLKPEADPYTYMYWDLLNETLESRRPALVFSVFGFDSWIDQIVRSQQVSMSWGQASSESSPLTISIAQKAQSAGAKGVAFTIPHFKYLPYFQWFTQHQLAQLPAKVTLLLNRTGILGSHPIQGEVLFLPTKNTELLFSTARQGGTFEFVLQDRDVADASEIVGGSPDALNTRIKNEAKPAGLLVVDLAALYEKIALGGYVTDDGYAITGGLRGNFFSSDGLYPSTLGNAVIANETIKVLNSKFGANIPLINITAFAGLLEK